MAIAKRFVYNKEVLDAIVHIRHSSAKTLSMPKIDVEYINLHIRV